MKIKMEKSEIIECAEKSKLEMNNLEILQKNFAEDIEKCEEEYNVILNSEGIDNTVKLEMLRILRVKIEEIKESYENNVVEEMERQKEEYEEYVEQMLEKAREYERLKEKIGQKSYSSIEKSEINSTMDKINESVLSETKEYRELAKKNSEVLADKMEQFQRINRQIMRTRL